MASRTKKKARATAKKPTATRSAAKTKQPAAVRAKANRAPNKQTDLSRAEVSIMARMADLDADSPRYRALEAALAFKSSWIILGEHLASVLRMGLWRGWGYASFERYCADEVHVTSGTAKKLVRSFQWLGEEAPEYLPSSKKPHAVPDLGAVSVLADAKQHYDEHRVPEDAYLALKQAALEGESPSALRRALKDSIPAHLQPKSANDKVRHLRRALTACVKVIDSLREWDGEDDDKLIVDAERLRDAIALRLPREAPGSKDGAKNDDAADAA